VKCSRRDFPQHRLFSGKKSIECGIMPAGN
jgi:hypothetical protein